MLVASGGPSGDVAADVTISSPGIGPQETCAAPVVAGACQFTSCQVGGIGSPGPDYDDDLGPITATVGTTTVALTQNLKGLGTVVFPAPVALGTGGIMRFQAGEGGMVPAFDVSVTIPDVGVITSPVPATAGGAATVDTSQDLSVTWAPISVGQIKFRLSGGGSAPGDLAVLIACTFDGAPGSGVVPQTLLASLKQMSGTSPVYAELSAGLDATTVVDGLTIIAESSQTPPNPASSFDVTLQ
ncbi:MAG TPA: hypothetical protein VHO06_01415 [Polyangia bacterium]|nr:hypothetical protein [Polyangia bacterium]